MATLVGIAEIGIEVYGKLLLHHGAVGGNQHHIGLQHGQQIFVEAVRLLVDTRLLLGRKETPRGVGGKGGIDINVDGAVGHLPGDIVAGVQRIQSFLEVIEPLAVRLRFEIVVHSRCICLNILGVKRLFPVQGSRPGETVFAFGELLQRRVQPHCDDLSLRPVVSHHITKPENRDRNAPVICFCQKW